MSETTHQHDSQSASGHFDVSKAGRSQAPVPFQLSAGEAPPSGPPVQRSVVQRNCQANPGRSQYNPEDPRPTWYGVAEHAIIQEEFESQFSPDGVREYGIPKGSLSGNNTGYADCVDLARSQIYEIKPMNPAGIVAGTADLLRYVRAAQESCTPRAGIWTPGTNFSQFSFPSPNINGDTTIAEMHPSVPGLIVYYEQNRRRQGITDTFLAPLPSPQDDLTPNGGAEPVPVPEATGPGPVPEGEQTPEQSPEGIGQDLPGMDDLPTPESVPSSRCVGSVDEIVPEEGATYNVEGLGMVLITSGILMLLPIPGSRVVAAARIGRVLWGLGRVVLNNRGRALAAGAGAGTAGAAAAGEGCAAVPTS